MEWQNQVQVSTFRRGRYSFDTTQAITLTRGEDVIRIQIGIMGSRANDNTVDLAAPAQNVEGIAMMPIRHLLEYLGYYVGWDHATRTMHISKEPLPTTISAYQMPIEGTWQGIWGGTSPRGWITEGPVTF